ncbi:MAG: bifunctional pyr operon transcriptional regulator/uracil phosphoribosyltransferase PyrR [Candidatus Delongbacteria bacterium]|jgi:pyrimidine operon attenuation protein/uracil phosphoribosyltransferase|nr:bifunctional pyr operon transcriptional regulator/uracil phosphoribosyltransferase PyrR [Candidatus Delongbacteria bacterium]
MTDDNIIYTIMDDSKLQKVIKRISSEIIANYQGTYKLVIVGLKTRGEFIANRIIQEIRKSENIDIEIGVLDATLYRDDFRSNLKVPNIAIDDMPFMIDDKKIILVDDVVFTGRSILAAINALMDRGRPKIIQFAALIDRGLRELPIKADYIGEVVKTLPSQEIRVRLSEVDKEDSVYLIEKKN